MPLYKTITVRPGLDIWLWKIEEPEAELAKNIKLTARSKDRVGQMKSELHRRGFLSVRHLLAMAGYQDKDLQYTDAGKPHLKDGKHISISHSYTYTGIIIGTDDEVGIDIEKQREKILRIAHKFTIVEEYRKIPDNEALIRKLTVVWGAKEALYKIYATYGLSFLHHIFIQDFLVSDGRTSGEICYDDEVSYYDIFFLEFDGFTCVYAIGERQPENYCNPR